MQPDAQPDLLRAGLLEGSVVIVAGVQGNGFGAAAAEACERAGGTVAWCEPAAADEDATTAAMGKLIAELGGLHTLIVDAARLMSDEGGRPEAAAGLDPVRAGLEGAWVVARAAATHVLIENESGGKIVFIGPSPVATKHDRTAHGALENMARTLSIEWSRYAIRPTAILPGAATEAGDVGALAAYLASPAGDYFGGCAFTLGGATG